MNISYKNNFQILSYIVINNIFTFVSNILQFSLSLYVLDETKSSTIFATILGIVILPRILISPISGVISDRFEKKRTLLLSIFFNILGLIIFTYILKNKGFSILIIYLFVIMQEVVEIFFINTFATYLPIIADKDEIVKVSSLNAIIDNIILVSAPVIASLIYSKINFVKLVVIFLLILSFIIPFILKLPTYKNDTSSGDSFIDEIKEGFLYIKNNKFVRRMCFIIPMSNFFLTPIYTISIIFFLKNSLEVPDFWIGGFYSIATFISIVAPVVILKLNNRLDSKKIMYYSYIGISFGLMISCISMLFFRFNIKDIYVIAFILAVGMAVTEFFSTLSAILESSYIKESIQIEHLGKTIALINLFATIFYPISEILYGLIIDVFPIHYTLFISIIGMLWNTYLSKGILFSNDK